MNHFQSQFERLTSDERYKRNLNWGEPRPGHPEGTVKAHIAELEENLQKLGLDDSSDDYWKLRILIHVHDSFKAESSPKVAIPDSRSHSSLAAAFLAEYCQDQDLLNMVQYHDEPYALWRQAREKGKPNHDRLQHLIQKINDWRLFLMFSTIDGFTVGKSIEPLEWAASNIACCVGLESFAREMIRRIAE